MVQEALLRAYAAWLELKNPDLPALLVWFAAHSGPYLG
jgi:hypothetical protein